MSWKRTIRPATDRLGKYSGLLRACEWGMRSGITALMYHRVLPDADCADYPFPSLVMPRSMFAAQVDWLADHARVLPLGVALGQLGNASSGPKPLVCLTFDDGYADNFEVAAPLLEARELRGTFFVTAGAIEARKPLWYDRAASMWSSLGRQGIGERLAEGGISGMEDDPSREAWIEWLKTIPKDRRDRVMEMLETEMSDHGAPCELMTAEQVRSLAERGHEIGSHTLWHPILTSMNAGERRGEIDEAKKLIERWTGRDAAGFCYPNGDFDEAVIQQLRELGHRYGCTTRPGCNEAGADPFRLRRIDVTPDRVSTLDGRFDPLGFRAEISLFRERLRGGLGPDLGRGR